MRARERERTHDARRDGTADRSEGAFILFVRDEEHPCVGCDAMCDVMLCDAKKLPRAHVSKTRMRCAAVVNVLLIEMNRDEPRKFSRYVLGRLPNRRIESETLHSVTG